MKHYFGITIITVIITSTAISAPTDVASFPTVMGGAPFALIKAGCCKAAFMGALLRRILIP